MRWRRLPLMIVPTLVAACDGAQPQPQPQLPQPSKSAANAPAPDNRIACALPATPDFAPRCTLEQRGMVMIVRQPDGGFHRLRRIAESPGIVAADGAEVATVFDVDDGSIEVAIGGARYRLPAE